MTIEELRGTLTGAVFAQGDEGFAEARAGHSGADAPELVLRARSVADVVTGVRYAAAEELPLGVRSGGHSHWGTLPGGLLVDLADLDAVEVDGELVRIGGGATWGEVAAALAGHGLALTSGDTASVGVGGLTLGGGVGWMVRLWGLALDQLEAAEVVTAAGEVVPASAEENADLFWALRGGGGNFGVVTRFDFRAHPLPSIISGTITFAEDADPVAILTAWREAMRVSPEELNSTFLAIPAMGQPGPAGPQVRVCYADSDETAAALAIAPLLTLPGIEDSTIAPAAYADILIEQQGPGGQMAGMVDGNGFATEFTDELIREVVAMRADSAPAVLMIRYLRGAFNRVPADATAFAHRDAEVLLISAAFLPQDSPESEFERRREAWRKVERQTLGRYGNFTSSSRDDHLTRMYPEETLRRLREVKRKWDPRNLFGRNHNIAPD